MKKLKNLLVFIVFLFPFLTSAQSWDGNRISRNVNNKAGYIIINDNTGANASAGFWGVVSGDTVAFYITEDSTFIESMNPISINNVVSVAELIHAKGTIVVNSGSNTYTFPAVRPDSADLLVALDGNGNMGWKNIYELGLDTTPVVIPDHNHYLNSLLDVNVIDLDNEDILVWNVAQNKWITMALASVTGDNYVTNITFDSLTGDVFLERGSLGDLRANIDGRYSLKDHNHKLTSLIDVDTTGVQKFDVLQWDGDSSWIPGVIAGGNLDSIYVDTTATVNVGWISNGDTIVIPNQELYVNYGAWGALDDGYLYRGDTLYISTSSETLIDTASLWYLRGDTLNPLSTQYVIGVGGTYVNPQAKLHIHGNLAVDNGFKMFKNNNLFMHAQGTNSVFLGTGSGNLTTTGYYNTAVGDSSERYLTSGWFNTAVGHSSLNKIANGNHNTALGAHSLNSAISSEDNVALGCATMHFNTGGVNGSFNTVVGSHANQLATTGARNVYIGFEAAKVNNGNRNVFIGYQVGRSMVTTSDQLFINNSDANRFNSLIWGDFAADSIYLNGSVGIGASSGTIAYILPRTRGTSGQVLTYPSSGKTLIWATPGGISGTNYWYKQDSNLSPLYDTNSVSIGQHDFPADGGRFYVKNYIGFHQTKGNVRLGYKALHAYMDGAYKATSGIYNATIIGSNAGYNKYNGNEDVFIGSNVGYYSTTSRNNTIVGTGAASLSTGGNFTGAYNSIYGNNAGKTITSGSYNVLLGNKAGQTLTSGASNIFIGNEAGSTETTVSNQLLIDNSSGNKYTSFIWGDMGPADSLSFAANLIIRKTAGAGTAYVLTRNSGNNGDVLTYNSTTKVASWVAPSAGGSSKWTANGSNIYPTTATGVAVNATSIPANYGPFYVQNYVEFDDALLNTALGTDVLYNNTIGELNTGIGSGALFTNITGGHNTAMGPMALYYNNAHYNTGIGCNSGNGFTTGSYNTTIGAHSFFGSSNTGEYNTALGAMSGTNTTGNRNILIGSYAGYSNTQKNMSYNLFIEPSYANKYSAFIWGDMLNDSLVFNARTGFGKLDGSGRAYFMPNTMGTSGQALLVPSSGNVLEWGSPPSVGSYWTLAGITLHPQSDSYDVGIGCSSIPTGYGKFYVPGYIEFDGNNNSTRLGYAALNFELVAEGNTAIGSRAAYATGEGVRNTVIGTNALYNNTINSDNTVIGYNSLANNDGNSQTVAIGSYSGYDATGENNVFVGTNSGYTTVGDGNTFIGKGSGVNISGNNNIVLGNYEGNPTANNMLYIGNYKTQGVIENPILLADMANDSLWVNGYLGIKNGNSTVFTFPRTIGTPGQSLKVPNSGNMLEWGNTQTPPIENLFVVVQCDSATTCPDSIDNWITIGDTLWIDTTGGKNLYSYLSGDTLFLGNDTIIFENNDVWLATSLSIFPKDLLKNVGIGTNNPEGFDVNKTSIFRKPVRVIGYSTTQPSLKVEPTGSQKGIEITLTGNGGIGSYYDLAGSNTTGIKMLTTTNGYNSNFIDIKTKTPGTSGGNMILLQDSTATGINNTTNFIKAVGLNNVEKFKVDNTGKVLASDLKLLNAGSMDNDTILSYSPSTGEVGYKIDNSGGSTIENLFVIKQCDTASCPIGIEGWITVGDTMWVDTTGGQNLSFYLNGDTLFIGNDTVIFTNNDLWTSTGNNIIQKDQNKNVIIGGSSNPENSKLYVNGNAIFGNVFKDGKISIYGTTTGLTMTTSSMNPAAYSIDLGGFNSGIYGNYLYNGINMNTTSAAYFTATFTNAAYGGRALKTDGRLFMLNPTESTIDSMDYKWVWNKATGESKIVPNTYGTPAAPLAKVVTDTLQTGAYVFPVADGISNQVLKTDGAGNVTWGTVAAGGSTPLSNIIYVDARSGNDGTARRGDILKPFLTLRAAIDSFANGNVIVVMPGTYNVETTSNSNEGLNLIRKSNGTYINDMTIYLYAGARVIKANGKSLLMENAYSATRYTRILGNGTLIRNTTAPPDVTANSVLYTSGSLFYLEADSVISTLGATIVAPTIHISDNKRNSILKLRYCEATLGVCVSGHHFDILGGRYVSKGAYNVISMIAGLEYTSDIASLIEGSFENTTNSQTAISIGTYFTGTIRGKFNVPYGTCVSVAANYGKNFKLEVGSISSLTYTIIENGGGSSATISQVDVSCNSYGFARPMIKNTAQYALTKISGLWPIMPQIICSNGEIIYEAQFKAQTGADLLSEAFATVTGGRLVIKGSMDITGIYRTTPPIKVTNATLILDGKIEFSGTNLYNTNSTKAIVSVNGTTGKLVLTNNAVIVDKGNDTTKVNGLICIAGQATIVDYGAKLQGVTGQYSINVTGGLLTSTDTVACTYINMGNTYTNVPYLVQPGITGTALLSSFDFSTANKTLEVSYQGGSPATITLDENCVTTAAICTHITNELATAGFGNLEAVPGYLDTRYVYIRVKKNPAVYSSESLKFQLHSGSALTTLGMTAKEYKANIYKKVTSGGSIIYDTDIVIQ